MKALFIILPIVLLVGFIFWAFIAFKPNENGKSNIVQGIIASILALISLFVLIIVPGSIHQVNAGEVAVVKIWGDAREVRSAGIYFDGWLSHKYEIYDCKVQQIPISTSAYSNDSQPMDIELYVQYQIQQENAMKIATNYGGLDMLEGRIQTVSIERMKAVLSKYAAEALIKTRNTISPEVEQSVKEAITTDYFVNITTIVLTNIDFSDAFEKSVEDKMIAEQEKLKAEYENERAKEKAEADLEIAKKEAEAIKAKAEQQAEAQKLLADAEAYALNKLNETWSSLTNEQKEAILKKQFIEQWDGKLPDTMVGDSFLKWITDTLGA